MTKRKSRTIGLALSEGQLGTLKLAAEGEARTVSTFIARAVQRVIDDPEIYLLPVLNIARNHSRASSRNGGSSIARTSAVLEADLYDRLTATAEDSSLAVHALVRAIIVDATAGIEAAITPRADSLEALATAEVHALASRCSLRDHETFPAGQARMSAIRTKVRALAREADNMGVRDKAGDGPAVALARAAGALLLPEQTVWRACLARVVLAGKARL